MRKLLLFVTLSACLLLSNALVAQTYTFNGSMSPNWNNANNWTPMGVPTSPLTAGTIVIAANSTQNIDFIIGSSAALIINSGFTLTRTSASSDLTIQGSMTNNGTLVNNRVLSITSSGMLTNNGIINNGNSGNDNINNSGTIQNNSIINMLIGTLNNLGTGVINNNAAGSITISSGAFLTNQNDLNNAGTITNNGTLNAATGATDVFNNTGTLINNLNIIIGNSGTLLNAVSGSITNNSGSSLTVNNAGFLVNNGLLNNSGTVNNNNSITNAGTFNNNSGGVLNNGNVPPGNSNGDIFDNTGILNNNIGATINNYNGATINTTSGVYINNGNYNGNAPLPIELLSFVGKQQDNSVLLKWETASEKENAYMAVERSKDGVHFQEIGQRKGAGTTTLRQLYDFTDTTPSFGVNYYRLRQVDADNKATYHEIIAVEFTGKTIAVSDIQLYPTLSTGDLTIVFQAAATENRLLQVFDVNGKMLKQKTFAPEVQQDKVTVSDLPAGTYFATIKTGSAVQTLRFIRM